MTLYNTFNSKHPLLVLDKLPILPLNQISSSLINSKDTANLHLYVSCRILRAIIWILKPKALVHHELLVHAELTSHILISVEISSYLIFFNSSGRVSVLSYLV